MKMRFNIGRGRRRLLFGAIFFVALADAPMLWAKERSQIFEENKEKILSSRCCMVDGYVFAVGKMISRSANREVGFSKAKLDAANHILDSLTSRIDWPQDIPAALRGRIWQEYLKCVPLDLILQGNEVIYREAKGDRHTVVTAVPEKNITAAPPPFSVICRTLLMPQNYQSGKLNVSVCIELCRGNIPQTLLEAYADKLGREYGVNVKRMILGQTAVSFICRLEAAAAEQSLPKLLELLALSPYDPELCFAVGAELERSGLKYTADIFYARGSIAAAYLPEFAQKCRAKHPAAPVAPMPVLPPMLFTASAGRADFTEPGMKFLRNYAGMLPVGVSEKPVDPDFQAGEQAFACNRLDDAYRYYTRSVAAKVTFEGCNMAGNAGRRIGKDHESVALLLQAVIADQSIVYPWIHLAWIYRRLGLREQEKFCIEKIKTYHLDAWSSRQLELLAAETAAAAKQTP